MAAPCRKLPEKYHISGESAAAHDTDTGTFRTNEASFRKGAGAFRTGAATSSTGV